MSMIKYHASGHFDIETEIEMSETATEYEILSHIINDLIDRYGLEIEIL